MSLVRVRGLSVRFGDADATALPELDLDVAPGEVVLLEGMSGSGKSTLLRALSGLVPHFRGGRVAGEVRVGDVDPLRAPPAQTARIAAMAFQDPEAQAVMATVARDVAFGPECLGMPAAEIPGVVARALAATGAAHLASRSVGELSSGERQRAALAAVLAQRPRLLLLDEPTSQLDEEAAAALLAVVRGLADHSGTAVVIAEHRGDRALPIADRVLRMAAPAAGPVRDPLGALAVADGAAAALLEDVSLDLGGRTVLDCARLALPAGAVTAVTGPNGAGKTRLLRVLAGLERPGLGRVLLGGRDVTGVPAERRVPEVGLVPQDPGRHLLCERVDREVELGVRATGGGRAARRAAVEEALADLALESLAGRHPLDLSVGERERVAIAAITAMRPRVLALDEPTRGMDTGARARLGALLRARAREGAAVVVATHDPGFVAEWCDRVVAVADGRTAEAVPA